MRIRQIIYCSLIIFLSLPFLSFSQDDYRKYHQLINEGERQFFLQKNADSSLIFYDKAFNDFDFIFVKDLLNAAQIACFSEKPIDTYILRSFEFGLKLEHFQNYPILKSKVADLFKKQSVLDSFRLKRAKYIENIDFSYRSWISELSIDDQLSKSKPDYSKKVNILLGKILTRTLELGFPGERIIGIDDDHIYTEIGKPELEFSHLVESIKSKNIKYFQLNNDLLATKLPILPFIHHKCSYEKFKTVFMDEIIKGNIHPRDVGLIYDNVIRSSNRRRPTYCSNAIPKNYFLLNLFTEYPENWENEIGSINKLRADFFIVSVEVDNVKKKFEKEYGFNLFSGFWHCR